MACMATFPEGRAVPEPAAARILVIGRTGQLARALAAAAPPRGVEAVRVGRPAVQPGDFETVRMLLRLSRPDAVVNAAGFNDVDLAETRPTEAFAVNARCPAVLAEACVEAGVPLVHVSTDLVFDGSPPGRPYVETDAALPINAYGASKLAGEERVRASGAVHAIVRTSCVFGPDGRNFVTALLDRAAREEEVSVVNDLVACPTPVGALADAVLEVAAALVRAPELTGTYHFAGADGLSRHGWAAALLAAAREAGRETPRLRAVRSDMLNAAARRPGDTRLDSTRIREVFGIEAPDWRAALPDCVGRLPARREAA